MAESNVIKSDVDINDKRVRVSRQLDLLYILKQQMDLLYEQNKIQRVCLKNVAKFRQFMRIKCSGRKRTGTTTINDNNNEEIWNRFEKFDLNYRYWKKMVQTLNRKKFPNRDTLYDTMYDLYEDMILSDVDEVTEFDVDDYFKDDNLTTTMMMVEDPPVDPVRCNKPEIEQSNKDDEPKPKVMDVVSKKDTSNSAEKPSISLEKLLENYKKNVRTVSTRYSTNKKLFKEDDEVEDEEEDDDEDDDDDRGGYRSDNQTSFRVYNSDFKKSTKNSNKRIKLSDLNSEISKFPESEKKNNGTKLLICQDCGHNCRDRHSLIAHRYIHLGIKFVCTIGTCTASYSNKQNYRRHCRVRHGKHSSYVYTMVKEGNPDNVNSLSNQSSETSKVERATRINRGQNDRYKS